MGKRFTVVALFLILGLFLCLEASANSLNYQDKNSYKLAGIYFLPELIKQDLEYNTGLVNKDMNKNNCKGYGLTKCPTGGFCSKCPNDAKKLKLDSCNPELAYKKSGDTCIKKTCPELNSSYKTSVPLGQICTKFTEKTLTCYKSCRNVQCSGYSLNCSNKPANVSSMAKCPDCTSATANCSDNSCKISACNTNYKLNASGTGCILKDDTCPEGYYKSCETGTTGSPQYTEMGTACYQCKPVNSCDVNENFWNGNGSYTVSSAQKSINLYGNTNTTTIPSSGMNVCYAGWTYAGGAWVKGGSLNINGDMVIGIHGNGNKTPIVFDVPVSVSGNIKIYKNSELVFLQGLSGSYSCYKDGSTTKVTCPFFASCNNNENYRNMDGSFTVPSTYKSISLYGGNNTTSLPSSGISVCYASWTFGSGATINGGALTVKGKLVIGEYGGGIKTPITFNVPVTVYGKIQLFRGSVPTFAKGISGNYSCYEGYSTPIDCPF